MEQSPSSEANSDSASQEITRLEPVGSLPCSQQAPPLVPVLSQMNPVHNYPPHFSEVHSNFIFPSTLRSSECFFLLGFPTKILYAFLISHTSATCPSHLTLHDLITRSAYSTGLYLVMHIVIKDVK